MIFHKNRSKRKKNGNIVISGVEYENSGIIKYKF